MEDEKRAEPAMLACDTVMSLMLIAARQKNLKPPSVQEISAKIIEFNNRGIHIGYNAMKRVPEGMWCEDVATLANYISFQNGVGGIIELSDEGLISCREIVRETFVENWRAVVLLAKELQCEIGFVGEIEP